jgi:hypothetical protein
MIKLTNLTITSVTRHFIDIPSLTQLRSIEFDVLVGPDGNKNRWITQILSQISSADLEDVVFNVFFSSGTSGAVSTVLEWKSVDAVLQRSTFSGLRNVRFVSNLSFASFDSTSDQPQLSSSHTSITERLPQCHARGIVHVDHW